MHIELNINIFVMFVITDRVHQHHCRRQVRHRRHHFITVIIRIAMPLARAAIYQSRCTNTESIEIQGPIISNNGTLNNNSNSNLRPVMIPILCISNKNGYPPLLMILLKTGTEIFHARKCVSFLNYARL